MENIPLPLPEIGVLLNVFHPCIGWAEMEVLEHSKANLTCGYEGVKFTVYLRKVASGMHLVQLRWEAEDI